MVTRSRSRIILIPGSRRGDQCDSISQALLGKNIPWMAWLSQEDWDRPLAEASIPWPRGDFRFGHEMRQILFLTFVVTQLLFFP
jgi:hypothetical protein